ncbi:hypothetical protein MMC12_000257 [Toensbergia leucococca]|nr:hypothetical protein [Toensbergia leucococca]
MDNTTSSSASPNAPDLTWDDWIPLDSLLRFPPLDSMDYTPPSSAPPSSASPSSASPSSASPPSSATPSSAAPDATDFDWEAWASEPEKSAEEPKVLPEFGVSFEDLSRQASTTQSPNKRKQPAEENQRAVKKARGDKEAPPTKEAPRVKKERASRQAKPDATNGGFIHRGVDKKYKSVPTKLKTNALDANGRKVAGSKPKWEGSGGS